VKVIRCDNGTEFKNRVMNQFCEMKGIKREFSIARTPQQNGVAERKNRTLIEAVRTMLADSNLPTTFWPEAVNTVKLEWRQYLQRLHTTTIIEETSTIQEKDDNINNTNNINIASDGNNTNNDDAVSSIVNVDVTKVNDVDPKTSIELP
ncbi:putative ribonuclease H-like domain-containing protein, partial [Tanacetum coccineum]